jgi:hypothetical protein
MKHGVISMIQMPVHGREIKEFPQAKEVKDVRVHEQKC